MKKELIEHKYLLQPGFIIIYNEPMLIYGVVGSGIFIGLWDEKKEYSGCCSYLYPHTGDNEQSTAFYGNIAIRWLIKKMRENGSQLPHLKALLMGGASKNNVKIGQENIHIAKEILNKFKIEIVSIDAGGRMGRKFIYETHTGHSITYKTNKLRNSDWYPYPN